MPKFLAQTSKGLKEVLVEEIKNFGFKGVQTHPLGVQFQGSWKDCYKAHFLLSTATRILLPVLDFPAYKPDDLYYNSKKHDFTKYIRPSQTLAIQSTVAESALKDQRFVSLKIKDSIVDQFREKFGNRPDVDKKKPDISIVVYVYKNTVSLALNCSGSTLSRRGYRKEQGEAPLREHLAAGLIHLTGWRPNQPLIDPMCGSGTLLLEAARIYMGGNRIGENQNFAFQKWKNFQQEAFDQVINELKNKPIQIAPQKMFGSDKDQQIIKSAESNRDRLGLSEELVHFKHMALINLKPPTEDKGYIVCNPPYGVRLQDKEKVLALLEQFGDVLKQNFSGWKLWVLSGEEEITKGLKMKSYQKYPVWNGPIECRWLGYEIR